MTFLITVLIIIVLLSMMANNDETAKSIHILAKEMDKIARESDRRLEEYRNANHGYIDTVTEKPKTDTYKSMFPGLDLPELSNEDKKLVNKLFTEKQ